MSSTPAALRHPRKFFGLPYLGLFIAMFWFLFFVITPFIAFINQYLNGFEIASKDYYFNGIATVLSLWFVYQVLVNGRYWWSMSTRKKYVRKRLIPFLNTKYGIAINPSNAVQIILQRPFALDNGTIVQFDGWPYLEFDAAHQHFKKEGVDVSEHLTLIVESGYELNHQYRNAPYASSDDVFTLAQDTSLAEPHLVQLALLNIFDNLPISTESVFNVINRNGDFFDIPASLQVSVDKGNLKYSPQDLEFLVDALSANISKNDTSLIHVSLKSSEENPQYHGIVFTKTGFDFVDDKDFKKMFHDDNQPLRYDAEYNWADFISRTK